MASTTSSITLITILLSALVLASALPDNGMGAPFQDGPTAVDMNVDGLSTADNHGALSNASASNGAVTAASDLSTDVEKYSDGLDGPQDLGSAPGAAGTALSVSGASSGAAGMGGGAMGGRRLLRQRA
jgi:hypothetical protein